MLAAPVALRVLTGERLPSLVRKPLALPPIRLAAGFLAARELEGFALAGSAGFAWGSGWGRSRGLRAQRARP